MEEKLRGIQRAKVRLLHKEIGSQFRLCGAGARGQAPTVKRTSQRYCPSPSFMQPLKAREENCWERFEDQARPLRALEIRLSRSLPGSRRGRICR